MAKPLTLRVRIPHILVDARDADPKLVQALAPSLQHLDARIRVLGKGLEKHKHVFSMEEAMEEGDVWLVLSGQLPKEFALILEHGMVPVMREGLHKSAQNYDPVKETGNAFLFDELNEWRIYAALVRAIENFAFPYDWKNIREDAIHMEV